MSGWTLFQDEINVRLDELAANGCPDPFFRGHGKSDWKLIPSLSRQIQNPCWHDNKEARLFHSFRDLGTHLMPPEISDWAVLFHMQHFGVPTRLLDWTTTFANALYFALKSKAESPTIWILNPYELNEAAGIGRNLSDLHRAYKMNYSEFLQLPMKPSGVTAVVGDYTVERTRHQRGNFTVHGDVQLPLEAFSPLSVSKHVLPDDAVAEANEFLQLAGVNEFQVFPDLDGLARYVLHSELKT